MMKILLPVLLFSVIATAETHTEEAIILNQELQFLEDSARDIRINTPSTNQTAEVASERNADELSLERTYFSETERDEIRTKAAAPRRRRSF